MDTGKVMIFDALPWAAAREIRDLLDEELPKLNLEEPPIIRDTVFDDEQGIYFTTPPVIKEEPGGVLVLTVRGSVWTWNGAKFCPDLEEVDVLDIELLPYSQGTKVKITSCQPSLKVGLVEYIETLIVGLFTGLGTPAAGGEPEGTWAFQTPTKDGAGDGDLEPWKRIPDVGNNRLLVELWDRGLLVDRIAYQIGERTNKTVYNRLSDLRKLYGPEVVYLRREKRKSG